MKHITIILLFLAATSFAAQAQILNKLGKKVERKVNERVGRKTDRAIDKGLEKVEGTVDGKAAGANKKKSTQSQDESFSASSKFDFIPGESILFYDNFEVDAKGD